MKPSLLVTRFALSSAALIYSLSGCGNDNPSDGASGGAAGNARGGATALGGSSSEGGRAEESRGGTGGQPSTAIELNGCVESAYEDRSGEADERTILIAASGLNYSPKCLTIAAGQTVTWQGSLASHPLAPGNPDDAAAGSSESPIVKTNSGTSIEFTFESAGVFPYYCELHSFGAGRGMAGVVHVLPAR